MRSFRFWQAPRLATRRSGRSWRGYGEHDFGSFEINGERVFWKIDYLQRGTQFGAEDPSDNGGTCRMITIMRAGEY